MRIGTGDKDVTIFAGQRNVQTTQDNKDISGRERKSVFAGNSNIMTTRDLIAQKKEKARQQAMKVVGDTFAADKAIDDDLNARRDRVHALKQEKHEYQSEINWYNEEQERLKEVYGVTDDDDAPKDPEYLSRVAEMDEIRKDYQRKIDKIDGQVEQENATIDAIRQERLKSDPMVKAGRQAEAIMAAASDEIVGMVVDDAKAHVDEESEKRKEQGEKIREERKEREELIEKRREKRDKAEELPEDAPIDEILDASRKQADVRQEVQEILQKLKLVPEDIKGAAVDEIL